MPISSKGLCLEILGGVKEHRKFPCGNPLLWVQTLTRDIHCTMCTWGQSEKSIASWLYRTMTERI